MPRFLPYDWIGVSSMSQVPPGFEVVDVAWPLKWWPADLGCRGGFAPKKPGWGERHERVRIIARKLRMQEGDA
jgi:hypothetical protein